jgi:hypothetical protein
VLDAYPTTARRANEYIADAYDVPIFVGAAPGEYILQVTLYNPDSGDVVGQRELGRVNVSAQTTSVPRELLGVNKTVQRDLGGVELSGFDLDASDSYGAGRAVPLTLLWRVLQNDAVEYDVTVTNEFGKIVTTQSSSVNGAAGQYVRQPLQVPLPPTLAQGNYFVRVSVRANLPLPFQSNTETLGMIAVRPP